MTFDTFSKNMDLLKSWRIKHSKTENEYPDSRDPDFREELTEAGVVPQDFEKSLVALAAWREQYPRSYQGVSAMVHLIRNRNNKGMFRSHLIKLDQEQFPSMTDPTHELINSYPEKEDSFERILGSLDDILDGKVVDITQGSLYFDHIDPVAIPFWLYKIKEDPAHERTVLIGGRFFYR